MEVKHKRKTARMDRKLNDINFVDMEYAITLCPCPPCRVGRTVQGRVTTRLTYTECRAVDPDEYKIEFIQKGSRTAGIGEPIEDERYV